MADASHGHELIIVRRHEDEEHEHHSSAWKVAHADFMTAMMAFFLIMWLINVTDDQVRKGISQYFNPIHMSEGSTELKGLNKPSGEQKEKGKDKGYSDLPLPGEALNLLKLSAGHAGSKSSGEEMTPEDAASALQAAAQAAAKLAEAHGETGTAGAAHDGGGHGEESSAGLAEALSALASGGRGPGESGDQAAFQDPYAVLARIAEEYSAEHPAGATSATNLAGDSRAAGSEGGPVDRDPFDPSYWQLSPLPEARADHPGRPGSVQRVPSGARPDAASSRDGVDVTGPVAVFPPPPAAPASQAKAAAVDAGKPAGPAPAASVAPPEAKDPAVVPLESAEAAKLDTKTKEAAVESAKMEAVESAKAAEAEKAAAADAKMEAIAAEIEQSIARVVADGKASPGISVAATSEGILVNLTDEVAYSMFPVGSAVPDGKTVVLLEQIAGVLAKRTGDVVVRGYTDARPFRSKDYDNWRLSAARAHMAYYMLTRGGLPESRVVAIEGHADRSLKNPQDPNSAENRRIEVLLREASP